MNELLKIISDINKLLHIKNNVIKNIYTYTKNNTLYCNLDLFGTKTFRLTSKNPNLLNIPNIKAILECFTAPEGYIIYKVDLNSLEDRILTNLSNCKNKIDIYNRNVDIHIFNAYFYNKDKFLNVLKKKDCEKNESYFKRIKEEINNGNKELKNIREFYKTFTYAINYGASIKTLSEKFDIDINEATNIYNTYYKLYPEILNLKEDIIKKLQDKGFIHLGLGCRLYSDTAYENIKTSFNAYCQFWSILTLLTIHDLHLYIDDNNLQNNVKIILTIYDSIYLYIKDNKKLISNIHSFIKEKLTKDFIENQKVKNKIESYIGKDFYNMERIND